MNRCEGAIWRWNRCGASGFAASDSPAQFRTVRRWHYIVGCWLYRMSEWINKFVLLSPRVTHRKRINLSLRLPGSQSPHITSHEKRPSPNDLITILHIDYKGIFKQIHCFWHWIETGEFLPFRLFWICSSIMKADNEQNDLAVCLLGARRLFRGERKEIARAAKRCQNEFVRLEKFDSYCRRWSWRPINGTQPIQHTFTLSFNPSTFAQWSTLCAHRATDHVDSTNMESLL